MHEKSGMYFAENKKYLIENRLSKRMAALGIKSYKDYFYHVKYDTTLKEFNMLMNLVTTNETSFYRNPPQLKSFQEEVLPLVIAKKRERNEPKRLRIWSAGCSTGEEPYTLAMIALEVIGETSGWQIEIIANDISEQVLYAARKGVFNEMTLRTTPPDIVRKYFTDNGTSYTISEKVKRLVKFSQVNLSDRRQMTQMNNFDFVFCRNVMIYFSDEVKKQIVKGYYNALGPRGYFFIGHSESLHGISRSFKLVYFKNALVYHKEENSLAARRADINPHPVGATVEATATAEASRAGATARRSAGSQQMASSHEATMEKLKQIQELLAGSRKKTGRKKVWI